MTVNEDEKVCRRRRGGGGCWQGDESPRWRQRSVKHASMRQLEVVGGDGKYEEVCCLERRKCTSKVKGNEGGVIY